MKHVRDLSAQCIAGMHYLAIPVLQHVNHQHYEQATLNHNEVVE
jgi:hypothetical protein